MNTGRMKVAGESRESGRRRSKDVWSETLRYKTLSPDATLESQPYGTKGENPQPRTHGGEQGISQVKGQGEETPVSLYFLQGG